jgi:hypothetical protein
MRSRSWRSVSASTSSGASPLRIRRSLRATTQIADLGPQLRVEVGWAALLIPMAPGSRSMTQG